MEGDTVWWINKTFTPPCLSPSPYLSFIHYRIALDNIETHISKRLKNARKKPIKKCCSIKRDWSVLSRALSSWFCLDEERMG